MVLSFKGFDTPPFLISTTWLCLDLCYRTLVSALRLPAVMLQVDPGLYIGTAADLNDRRALADAAVTHILSVDSVDPTPLLPADGKLCWKWISVLDEATSDLLSHMDECFLFIKEAVDGGGAVLVHW